MKTRIVLGLTSVVAATMCSTVLAQDDKAQNNKAPAPPIQASQAQAPLKRGEFRIDVLPTKEGVLLDIDSNDADVAVLFRTIAEKADLKILVSDDVRGKISGKLVHIAPKKYFNSKNFFGFFEFGKAGDTYLVVRGTQNPLAAISKSARKVPAPAPRFNPGQNKPQVPGNWRAFPFNGNNIYVVPLGPDEDNEKGAPSASTQLETNADDTATSPR